MLLVLGSILEELIELLEEEINELGLLLEDVLEDNILLPDGVDEVILLPLPPPLNLYEPTLELTSIFGGDL